MHKFQERKATQAAAYLIKRAGGRLNCMKLIKLLYLAERASLLKYGRPITFDRYYSLPHGPVLSLTYDKINLEANPANPSYWHSFISEREGHEVRLLVEDVPKDQLSQADEEILEKTFQEFAHMTQWQLSDYTHKLPEWHDPNGSSLPISLSEILTGGGVSKADAEDIEQILEEEAAIDRLWA